MKTIQIFSPHIDDAILSLGGCIINWRSKNFNVKINNIFTISNWTNEYPLSGKNYQKDVEITTVLRKKEESLVAKRIKYQFDFWDFLDLPLRIAFSENDTTLMEQNILEKITGCLNKSDYFFFPLGIDHPDHILIKNLSDKVLNKGYQLYFFEDLPYYSWGTFEYQKAYQNCYKDKIPVLEKIDFEKKSSLVGIYESQICEEDLRKIRAYAYDKTKNGYYERYWKQG